MIEEYGSQFRITRYNILIVFHGFGLDDNEEYKQCDIVINGHNAKNTSVTKTKGSMTRSILLAFTTIKTVKLSVFLKARLLML